MTQSVPEWKPHIARFMAVINLAKGKQNKRRQKNIYEYEIKELIYQVNRYINNLGPDYKVISVKYYYFAVLGPLSADWLEIPKEEIRKLQEAK